MIHIAIVYGERDLLELRIGSIGITARARWELPLSFHTEAFESSETEKENYCLLRAEILLSISDLGVRYLFRSGLTSPLLVRGPHYTHVYLLHAVYSQMASGGTSYA
eukprot:COSAG06_NODE_674_length_13168_cov_694.183641_8_plen_107_part_00